jgi:hypothetical protein
MPSTNDYYLQLKTQLDAASIAKKAALDAQLAQATNAQFGADGSITTQGTGTLDLNYQKDKRTLGSNAEGSGTLRSGQYGTKLAENETDYRSRVTAAKGTTAAAKAEVDTTAASQLAQYQAMYQTPTTKKTTKKKVTPTPRGGSTPTPSGGLTPIPQPNTRQSAPRSGSNQNAPRSGPMIPNNPSPAPGLGGLLGRNFLADRFGLPPFGSSPTTTLPPKKNK